jgi:glutathione S-transferase
MITLYDFGNSVACQKVRVVMCEKGLDWETVVVDLFRAEQFNFQYLQLNPKGVVPTIIHDGKILTESTVICEYLDDTFPEPRLVPMDPFQRASMRLWSKTVDEGLHEGITEISFSAMFRERMRAMPSEVREARFRNIGDPRRRDRFKSTYELGPQSPFVLYAIAAYERAFEMLEKTLTNDRPWILGAQFTLADIALIPYMARLDYLGLISLWTDNRPHVRDWWAQVCARPSFKRGLYERITETEFNEMMTHGPKIRSDLAEVLSDLRNDTIK